MTCPQAMNGNQVKRIRCAPAVIYRWPSQER